MRQIFHLNSVFSLLLFHLQLSLNAPTTNFLSSAIKDEMCNIPVSAKRGKHIPLWFKHVWEVVMNINVQSDVQGLLWACKAIWLQEHRDYTTLFLVGWCSGWIQRWTWGPLGKQRARCIEIGGQWYSSSPGDWQKICVFIHTQMHTEKCFK